MDRPGYLGGNNVRFIRTAGQLTTSIYSCLPYEKKTQHNQEGGPSVRNMR
mgnify:CR=1 FL=1